MNKKVSTNLSKLRLYFYTFLISSLFIFIHYYCWPFLFIALLIYYCSNYLQQFISPCCSLFVGVSLGRPPCCSSRCTMETPNSAVCFCCTRWRFISRCGAEWWYLLFYQQLFPNLSAKCWELPCNQSRPQFGSLKPRKPLSSTVRLSMSAVLLLHWAGQPAVSAWRCAGNATWLPFSTWA